MRKVIEIEFAVQIEVPKLQDFDVSWIQNFNFRFLLNAVNSNENKKKIVIESTLSFTPIAINFLRLYRLKISHVLQPLNCCINVNIDSIITLRRNLLPPMDKKGNIFFYSLFTPFVIWYSVRLIIETNFLKFIIWVIVFVITLWAKTEYWFVFVCKPGEIKTCNLVYTSNEQLIDVWVLLLNFIFIYFTWFWST